MSIHSHSVEYADEYFPPKYAPPTNNINYNNSYVTRTDYARYCSPTNNQQNQLQQQKYAAQRQLSSASSMDQHTNTSRTPGSSPAGQLYHARSVSTTVPTNVVLPMQDNGLPAGTRSSLIV